MNGSNRRGLAAFLLFLWVFTACNGIFSATGCVGTPQADELFFYRSKAVEAELTLNCNGTVSVFKYTGKGNACRVEFLSPEELIGFSVELTEEGGRVTVDGLSAPAPDALCTVPNIMVAILTLSPENVTSIETSPHPEKADESVTKVTAGDITVTLNGEGLPIYADGVCHGIQFTAKIADLTVNLGENRD